MRHPGCWALWLVGAAGGDRDFGGDGVGEGHADAVFGAEDDHGAGFDFLAGGQFQVVFAEEGAEDHEDLEHGVVAADAAARASAKGDVGEGRVCGLVGLAEALGVEGFGVGPVTRGMVRSVDVDDDGAAGGDDGVAYAVVGDGFAVDHPEGGIEAESFVDDLRGEDEPGDGAEFERLALEDFVELGADAGEGFGMGAEEVEKPS